ncbi:MAG: outer membrane beta-barrel protein [Bacteroidota bacterium]|nr:outer membrane beta-barrel protein [Bacteroidota bacterium]MDX5431591.1 outer membrane beta-barrel protein [Bacteroidota bacterium]MDX5470311.1 outer membrane beta-barrel protein [Bacteroidota bacterium]
MLRKTRAILALITLFLHQQGLQAQEESRFQLEANFGYGVAHRILRQTEPDDMLTQMINNRNTYEHPVFAWQSNLYGVWKMSTRSQLAGGFRFAERGYGYTSGPLRTLDSTFATAQAVYSSGWLEIPIEFRYRVTSENKKWLTYLKAGAYFGIKLNARIESRVEEAGKVWTSDREDDLIRNYAAGLELGILSKYHFNEHWNFHMQLSYQQGILPLNVKKYNNSEARIFGYYWNLVPSTGISYFF